MKHIATRRIDTGKAGIFEAGQEVTGLSEADRKPLLECGALVEQKGGKNAALFGSSSHPARVSVGSQAVDIGDIVATAQADSGLSADAWNALSEETRDKLIDSTLKAAQAGALAEQEKQSAHAEADAVKSGEAERMAAEKDQADKNLEATKAKPTKPGKPERT